MDGSMTRLTVTHEKSATGAFMGLNHALFELVFSFNYLKSLVLFPIFPLAVIPRHYDIYRKSVLILILLFVWTPLGHWPSEQVPKAAHARGTRGCPGGMPAQPLRQLLLEHSNFLGSLASTKRHSYSPANKLSCSS